LYIAKVKNYFLFYLCPELFLLLASVKNLPIIISKQQLVSILYTTNVLIGIKNKILEGMLFQEITGQADIKQKLIQAVKNNRVSHAMLFTGMEGAGMLGLAIAFATYLNCENPLPDDSCNECPSCRKYGKLIHPDLHFVFPVAGRPKETEKSEGKSVVSDDFLATWRESVLANPYMSLFQWYVQMGIENKQGSISREESRQIIKKLSLKSFEARYKVMIIWMAEKMNISASNTLLKLFEEPPPNTIFILIAEDPGQLLTTILSRCQFIRVPPIARADMEDAIRKVHGIDDQDQVDGLARLADGSYMKLLEAINEGSDVKHHLEMFISFMRLCYMPDITGIGSWVETISGQGREKQKQFLKYALRIIRGSLMLNVGVAEIDLLSEQERDFSVKFSKFMHPGNVGFIYEEFNKASIHIESNGYNRLIFFDLAIKTARLLKS
jgi:DNA polymerase III subunit delta'